MDKDTHIYLIYQNVYQFVPLQDFTSSSDIDWSKSIENINLQLYSKYKITKEEIILKKDGYLINKEKFDTDDKISNNIEFIDNEDNEIWEAPLQ
jgi:hypothetical protein